jgi:phospholipase A2-like protein
MSTFTANKSRVDSMFYFDLKAKCNTYNVFVRPACLSLAWTYYQAVSTFGSLRGPQREIENARALLNGASAA